MNYCKSIFIRVLCRHDPTSLKSQQELDAACGCTACLCDTKEYSTVAEAGTIGVANDGVAGIFGLQSCRRGLATAHRRPLFSEFSIQYLPAFIELLVLCYTVFAATAFASHNGTVKYAIFAMSQTSEPSLCVFVAVCPSSAEAHGRC